MDNCWDYADGEAERRMGNALRDGYRQKVFLMTKFDGRTKESLAGRSTKSLKRLQTDRIDLMQYHENIRMEDPDLFFGSRRTAGSLVGSQEGGEDPLHWLSPGTRIRSCIFACVEIAAKHQFHFDSCQMPLNVMDYHSGASRTRLVPKLVEPRHRGVGDEDHGQRDHPAQWQGTAIECLHYALNLPTSVVITVWIRSREWSRLWKAVRTLSR